MNKIGKFIKEKKKRDYLSIIVHTLKKHINSFFAFSIINDEFEPNKKIENMVNPNIISFRSLIINLENIRVSKDGILSSFSLLDLDSVSFNYELLNFKLCSITDEQVEKEIKCMINPDGNYSYNGGIYTRKEIEELISKLLLEISFDIKIYIENESESIFKVSEKALFKK